MFQFQTLIVLPPLYSVYPYPSPLSPDYGRMRAGEGTRRKQFVCEQTPVHALLSPTDSQMPKLLGKGQELYISLEIRLWVVY